MSAAAGKLPSLDGLRGIAIALVLIGHLHATPGFPELGLEHLLGDYGLLGVRIFFVISGFLITTLLLRELDQHGAISLKAFYARRALRILPASLAFLAAIGIAAWLGWIAVGRGEWLAALAYTMNYVPVPSWEIGHLWSLSVEEQFYLLWPLLLARAELRRAALVALAFFLLAAPLRVAMRVLIDDTALEDLPVFPAVADGIAIGCLFAIARPWLRAQVWYLRASDPRWLPLQVPLVFVIHHASNAWGWVDLLGYPLLLLQVAMIVEASTRWDPRRLAARVLNAAPLAWLGSVSYSLYLWQQPFLHHRLQAVHTTFPLNLTLAFGMALLSYHLLERPLLRLRGRFARVAPAADTLRPAAPPGSTTTRP
jgi:peptidoglycan/LPS O-acetylase OafA/YrhL